MNCISCGKTLVGALDTYGGVSREKCFDCYFADIEIVMPSRLETITDLEIEIRELEELIETLDDDPDERALYMDDLGYRQALLVEERRRWQQYEQIMADANARKLDKWRTAALS